MQLRYYQNDVIGYCLNSITNTQLYVLPTGAGKTVIFTELARKLLEVNKKILILADMKILIKQIKERTPFSFNLRVETKQTFSRRLDFQPDYIIIDECHMVDSSSKNQYSKIIESYKDSIIIGFTATPIRMNNGLLYGKDKFWSKIDYEITTKQLILENYLCPYRVQIPYEFKQDSLKKNFTTSEASELMQSKYLIDIVLDSYRRFARKKTLIFACDIEHSNLLKEEFENNNFKVKVVHSRLESREIEHTLQQFKNNLLDCVINVDMLTKGFDEPSVDTIILARPTYSIALHRQIVGRGLRIHENKDDCLVIDLVGNFERNGDIADSIKWNKKKRKKNPYFLCNNCYTANFLESLPEDKQDICFSCGHQQIKVKNETIKALGKESTDILATQYRELNFLEKEYIQIKSYSASVSLDSNQEQILNVKFHYKKDGLDFKKLKKFHNGNVDYFKKVIKFLGGEYNPNLDLYKNITRNNFLNTFIVDFLS